MAENTDQAETTSPPVTKSTSSGSGSNKTLLLVILGGFGLFCFICFCCIALVGLGFGIIYEDVSASLESADALCGADENQLEDAYNNNFTDDYKRFNDFEDLNEIAEAYPIFFGDCEKNYSEYGFSDFANGFTFDYSSATGEDATTSVEITQDDYILDMTITREDGDSEWLIDNIGVRRSSGN